MKVGDTVYIKASVLLVPNENRTMMKVKTIDSECQVWCLPSEVVSDPLVTKLEGNSEK